MTGILVDTSVWIRHFRARDEVLIATLQNNAVLCHPWILGEVASGSPPHRQHTLSMMALLKQTPMVSVDETLTFIDRHALYGKGCGWVDLTLLACARLSGNKLWTWDRRLDSLAAGLGLSWRPLQH